MKRRARTLAIAAAVPALLVAALVAGAWWLLGTSAGARFAIARGGSLLPGRIEVGRVEGPLAGPLRLHDLVYRRDRLTLRVDRALLRWRPSDLLHGQLDVRRLAASGVRLELGGREPAAGFELPRLDLPVRVLLREAVVRDVVVEAGAGDPIRVHAAELTTAIRDGRMVIESFDLESPDLELELTGSIAPGRRDALALEAAWAYRSPRGVRYRGSGTVGGTLGRLELEQRLVEPFAARLDARVGDPLRRPTIEGEFAATDVRLARLDDSLPPGRLALELSLDGAVGDLAARGDAVWESREHGAWRADLAIERAGESWSIERLRVAPAAGRGSITAAGEVSFGDPVRFDLESRWRELSWPPAAAGVPLVSSPRGALAIEGTPAEYELSAQLELLVPPPQARAAFLAVAGEAGGLPALAPPGAVGRNGPLRAELRIAATGARRSVRIERLRGTLEGLPLRGGGHVELRGGELRVPRAELLWGDSEIVATGISGDRLDLRFDLGERALERLAPGLEGELEIEGRLGGAWESPAVRVELDGRRVELGELRIGALAGTVRIGSGAGAPLEVALAAREVRYAGMRFAAGRLSAEGRRRAHTVELALTGGGPVLERALLGGEGGLLEGRWRGVVERMALRLGRQETWRLRSAAPLAIAGGGSVRVGELCLGSRQATACAAGSWRGLREWSVEARASELPLDRLIGSWRPGLRLEGTVAGSLRVEAAGAGAVRGRAVLVSSGGSIALPAMPQSSGPVAYRDARLVVAAGRQGTRAEAEVDLAGVGDLRGSLALPGWSALRLPPGEQPLRGNLRAEASSIAPLAVWLDTLVAPRGRFDAAFEVGGTVGDPRFTGRARLRDGRAFVVPLGIAVENAQLIAQPGPAGELRLEGSLESGGGTLRAHGLLPLDREGVLARLELSGEGVLVMDTPDRRVVASTGGVSLVWRDSRIVVRGGVRVTEGSIELGGGDPQPVTSSADVVYLTTRAQDAGLGLALDARVRLEVGDGVEVTGLGFDAEVDGALVLVERPGEEARAWGELDLAGGTFSLYRRELEITRGRLLFDGDPVRNPRLDMRAGRRAGTVTAGLEAEGRLRSPRVTLWSEPPLPEAEQLSYLVLGGPAGNVTPEQADVLAGVARSIGLPSGRALAAQLGTLLGLEHRRIHIGRGTVDAASLVLGRFLTPRLYVAYGAGLFEGANQFLLRYLLSEHVMFVGVSGDSTHGDAVYEVENGRGRARPDLEPRLPDLFDDDG